MSERRTSIRLGTIGGMSDHGRKTPAEMIALYRTYARAALAEAQAVLAAPELERSREQYGYAVDRVQHHQERAEKAEQSIQRVRWQCDSWSHGNSWNKAARNAILRTLDGGAS